MKKKILFGFIFQILCIGLYAQTWTIDFNENYNAELTEITQEQWSRIVRSHETTDECAMLSFKDHIEAYPEEVIEGRILKGQSPKFNGYYYILVKLIPKNDLAKIALNYISALILYGNSKTGTMVIQFLHTDFPNSVSLKFQRNEYIRQKNELIKLVNGE